MRHFSRVTLQTAALAFLAVSLTSCDVIASLDLGAVGERNDRAAEYAREGDIEDEGFFTSAP